MKIQNLGIIFLVIAIPVLVLLSYYLNLQRDTLELQSQYATKLAEATKEGIKAFEVNTVDWREWVGDTTRTTTRNNAMAVVNTFITSLSNSLNLTGTAKEYITNYIPAVVMTMYNGYYIYAPTYVPITLETSDGVQLYYNADERILTTDAANGKNLPAYKPKDNATNVITDEYQDQNDNTISHDFVVDLSEADTEYIHMLSNQMAYAAQYSKGTNTNIVVNYTLDNRIYIMGRVNGQVVEEDGYLVYFDSSAEMPRIHLRTNNPTGDSDIIVDNSIKNTTYENTLIEPEILEEQIVYFDGSSHKLGTFKYIYDINHDKLYYDENADNFFTISPDDQSKQFINDSSNISMGSDGCRYKSVSVLLGNNTNATEYKKIYQVLNGKDKGKWYIDIKQNPSDVSEQGIEGLDTQLSAATISALDLDDIRFSTRYRDFSAINYYVESYAFTNWVGDNLSGVKQGIGNEAKDIIVEGTLVDIFKITEQNDLEKEYSPISIHKREIMENNINTNLNLSISNYSRGTFNFRLPVLTDSDWDQVFSNISLITFFQGVPIGLKYFNNYAIATSTTNREYVDPDQIYLSGEDPNYHRVYCVKCEDYIHKNPIYTGYRSVEYILREFKKYDANNIQIGETIYYYQHDKYDDSTNTNSQTACYYCIVNKENFIETTNEYMIYLQTKAYNEALARERYYQKEIIKGELES